MKSEDLRLNIIVNGDAGRKEILDTEKAISKLESELKSLKKAEGDNSKEIAETNKKLTEAKSKYAELQRQMSLDQKTMAELKSHIKATRAALEKAVPGTENWEALNRELSISRQRFNELAKQASDTRGVLMTGWEKFAGFAVAVNNVTHLISRFRGQIEQAKQSWLQYDEALVDAMKTTGLSRDEIEDLSEELKKFDTRTAQNELLSLARVGGKLGLSAKEDLLEFVSAADKINVALKEDLGGDAEAAIGQIGKLVDIFQLKGQMGLERAMLSVGSAINELGAASTANEGYIVNFTNRLAGIAPNASISIDKILGLASTLDANAQAAETAATAIGQTITAMFKKTETFAQIAKMPFEEFRDLLTNDVNGALVKVLEGMKGDQGLFDIVDAMDEMHLNGQRATTVLGALANNVEMLKEQQSLANEAFMDGTSLTNEFNTKNESATAVLEKTKKALEEQWVELGQKLTPALNAATSATTGIVSIVNQAIAIGIKYKAVIIAITAAYALMNLASAAKIVYDKLRHFYSAQNRADLLMEASLLQGCTKATMLQCAAQNLLAGNVIGATKAFKALGKAMLANPLGLIAAAIGALAGGIGTLVSRSREATKELRELNKRTVDTTSSFVKAQAEIDKERKSLEELKDAATKAAEGSDERKRVIDKINELYGDYLPQLLTEKTSNEELETALKNVNTQLEQKIKLQARENAEMDIQQHKMDAVKAALDSFNKRYEKMNKGQSLSAAQVGSLTGALSQYYDMPDISHFIEMRDVIAGIFNETIDNQDRQVNNIIALFTEAQENGAKLRSMVDGLFGVQSSGKNAPLGTLTDGSTEDSGGGTGGKGGTGGTGGKGSSGSSPVETAAEKSALALQKGLEQVFQEINEESEKLFQETLKRIEQDAEMKTQLVIDNEKDLTQKAIMEEDLRYEKERAKAGDNAELLELAETKHQNNLDKIKLDAFNREVKRLEDEHKLRRTQMENSQAAELLAFKGTEKEKAALKRKHTQELAEFDVKYLQDLEEKLQEVVDAKTLEGMSVGFDEKQYREIMQQLADIIKRKNAAAGEAEEDSHDPNEGHSIKEGTGKGSILGVAIDEWQVLIEHIKEGKLSAEDFQNVVTGIGSAAEYAFSTASKFMDLTKKKEDAQLKDYKKNQDNRKKSLEKRLNAGLITESQYNAQVEQMDAEYDAYQEELALKQAKRDKALNLTQAIINTALSVTSTIAQLGATPWGIAAAAIAAAMGAAEIAIIASQPVTSGAEEGGYIGVKRRQDGKSFNARLNPDARGFVSSPTVIVGENGSEYVIPHEALENPTLLPLISTMETARRNGKLRSLNFNAVYPATAMPGRVSGGFIDEGNSRIVTTSSDGHEDTATDAALTKAIEKLTKKLDEPITARVSMLGKGGIKETEDKYNKLKRRGQLG
jgi:TP901 family phage tail tape measure protein